MAVYYIDQVNGNDSTGTGSSAAPYKTITKALSVYANGDTIKLRGTAANPYREADLTLWGKTGITIQNDTGHTPRCALSVAYTSWAKTGGRTNVYQATCNAGANYGSWNGTTKLTNVADVATVDATTNSCWLDTTGHVLYVNIGGGAPASIESVSNYGGLFQANTAGDGTTISGIEIAYGSSGFIVLAGNNQRIVNCTASYVGQSGGTNGMIMLTGANGVIDNAQFVSFTQGVPAIYVSGTNHAVQNCTVAALLAINANTTGIAIGGGSGHVIKNCTVAQHSDGIHVGGGSTGVIVDHCIAHDCGHVHFITDQASSAVFKYCQAYLTYDTYGAGAGTGANGNSWGYTCEGGSTVSWYQCNANNMLRSTKPGNRGGFYALQSPSVATVKDCISYNNEVGYDLDTPAATMVNDYNCAYGNNSNYAGATQGAHDVLADPLFVDNTNNDYHLQLGSPARNAGIAIAGVNDAPGVQPPDIGYYDRGLTAPLDPVARMLTLPPRNRSLTLPPRK